MANPLTLHRAGRPEWLKDGLVFVGHWEPLIFRRRRGGLRSDEASIWEREHSDEAIADLKAAGCNLVITHFDKGFGLTAEAEDIAVTRDWAERLHRHGIRVGVYIRYDTLVPETIVHDQPGVENWIARLPSGEQPMVLGQYFRKAACPNSEEHLAYIENLLRLAILDLHVDLIHFDGFWIGHEAYACHCERCQRDFARFLCERYPDPASARARFGHARLQAIKPPVYHPLGAPLASMTHIDNPAIQEWIQYRCGKTAAILHRLSHTIRALSPEVAVEINTLIPTGYNHAYYWGFDLPSLAPDNDALWTEDDHWAHFREDGVIVSRIREFKIGRTLHNIVFSYQRGHTPAELQLSMAQAMAFNGQTIGMLGTPLLSEEPLYDLKCEIVGWFRRHFNRFAGTDSAADVALWRSQRTLAYNCREAQRSATLCEQMLIQGKVAFDIIFDDNLADLSQYRVLILPDVECITDEQAGLIERYVNAGGGLVATEASSQYDGWRRLRPQLALHSLFGSGVTFDPGDSWDPPHISSVGTAPFSQNAVGNGRVAYLSQITTQRGPTYSGTLDADLSFRVVRFPTAAWGMPLNAPDFLAALRWAAGGNLVAEVDAPDGVAIEVLRQPHGTILLHLVNYRLDQPVAAARVRLQVAPEIVVRQMSVLDLDRDDEQVITFTQTGEVVQCVVPAFAVYTVVALETTERLRLPG